MLPSGKERRGYGGSELYNLPNILFLSPVRHLTRPLKTGKISSKPALVVLGRLLDECNRQCICIIKLNLLKYLPFIFDQKSSNTLKETWKGVKSSQVLIYCSCHRCRSNLFILSIQQFCGGEDLTLWNFYSHVIPSLIATFVDFSLVGYRGISKIN